MFENETTAGGEAIPLDEEFRREPGRGSRALRGAARGTLSLAAAVILGVAAMLTANGGLLHPATAQAHDPTRPTPGREEAIRPLGTPLAAPATPGPYKFLATQADAKAPVAYDPCRPIHYVVRPDNAPPGGLAIVQDAIARVSQVTGLHFVYDGPTSETDSPDRAAYQPTRYGDRWAPVLFNWSTTGEDTALSGDVAGQGGSDRVTLTGQPTIYVTGHVDLDAAFFTTLLADPHVAHGPAQARAIILHELGHLVGLDHVQDVHELMNPVDVGNRDYQPGDLAGLSLLGAGACVPAL